MQHGKITVKELMGQDVVNEILGGMMFCLVVTYRRKHAKKFFCENKPDADVLLLCNNQFVFVMSYNFILLKKKF